VDREVFGDTEFTTLDRRALDLSQGRSEKA
jgi:hypothetical protein